MVPGQYDTMDIWINKLVSEPTFFSILIGSQHNLLEVLDSHCHVPRQATLDPETMATFVDCT